MARRKRATEFFKRKIARDVALVKSKAVAVVQFSDDGKIETSWNKNPDLGVIAIIGPGEAFGCHFPEAVLEEIGIGKSRPFSKAKVPKEFREKGRPNSIPSRNQAFRISAFQYQALAPIVFRLIQELSTHRIAHWQYDVFFSYDTHYLYSRKKRKDLRYAKMRSWPRGGRFAVRRDSPFAADIYWRLFNQEQTRKYLKGMARYIVRRLAEVNDKWQGEVDFSAIKAVQVVRQSIEDKKLPRYLLVEMLSFLPGPREYRLWPYIAGLIGWDGEEISLEKKKTAEALPEPKRRVGKIDLRITAGLEKKNGHIVFEVFSKGGSTLAINDVLRKNKSIRKRPPRNPPNLFEASERAAFRKDDELPF